MQHIRSSVHFRKKVFGNIFSEPKDLVELDLKKDCNVFYVGETKRSFKVRTNEHKRAVKNQDDER